MPIRTLVTYVGTAVCQVVRSLLHHFLPLDESRVEPVNPEEAVRKAAAKLTKIRCPTHLCIIGNMFMVAGDTCDSAPVLKAATAAFNAAAALEEIGVHLPLLSTVANMYNKKDGGVHQIPDTCMNFQKCGKAARTEPTNSATDTKEAEATGESEPADVLSTAVAFFKAAEMVEGLHSAPEIRTIADVFNVAKDSSDSAAVLKVATSVFYAAVRKVDIESWRDISAEELLKLNKAALSTT